MNSPIKDSQLPLKATPEAADTVAIIDQNGGANKQATLGSVMSALGGGGVATPDATTSTKGKVQLAGDLGGTAASPTVPGLSSKEPSVAAGTSSQYYRGDKSWQTLDKAAVGLSNVDNTSDAAKPVSTATQTALNAKAPTASPALTGTPTAPTAAPGTNTTQLATTAFTKTAIDNLGAGGTAVNLSNPSQAVWSDGYSYTLDDFTTNTARWVHSSGGSMALSDGAISVTSPAGGDTIAIRTLWSNILDGFDTLTFDVNFNGYTFTVGGDTPQLSFNQSGGDKWIVLSNFATNGSSAWQTVSLPLSKFTTNGDATSGAAGTGTVLAPGTTVSNLKIRVWDSVAGNVLSIRNLVLSDSTKTIKQDYIQPPLLTSAKPGSSAFRLQSMDIMKVTKDNVAGQSTDAYMANLLTAIKPLNPTHIGVSTPYDDAADYPSPVTSGYVERWNAAIRAEGFNVFWRQMPLEWEGIYSATKNTTRQPGTAAGVLNGSETDTYLKQIYDYIVAHPDQYEPGDILTPIAEPENGGISGVTGSAPYQFSTSNQFRKWLRDSITVANAALDEIGLRGQLHVGYFGNSGFIVFGNGGNPHGFLDERTVEAMTVIGMDNYPSTPSDMAADLSAFETIYGQRPLMLTEWGTINESSDATRKAAIDTVLSILKAKPYIQGLNYWTVIGGAGNANEDVFDYATFAPIGGFQNLQDQLTNGEPMVAATALATTDNQLVNVQAAKPSAGQVLTATNANEAAWRTLGAGSGVAALVSAPASASASGTAGQFAYDSGYIYVCTATNTWKRAAISSW